MANNVIAALRQDQSWQQILMKSVSNLYFGAALLCPLLIAAVKSQTSAEYLLEIRSNPRVVRPGAPVQLEITIIDPITGSRASNLLPTHDELFHVYIVSEDLRYFAHEHAGLDARGFLRVDTRFPRPGHYRILSEFHPAEAVEQFVVTSLIVGNKMIAAPEAGSATSIERNASLAPGETVLVSLRIESAAPQPGVKTPLIFTVNPPEGLEKFHGDWGQLLVVSDDLVDVIRAEPFFTDAGRIQFNVYFPRPRRYRMWMEYRHSGVVRKEAMDITVEELR